MQTCPGSASSPVARSRCGSGPTTWRRRSRARRSLEFPRARRRRRRQGPDPDADRGRRPADDHDDHHDHDDEADDDHDARPDADPDQDGQAAEAHGHADRDADSHGDADDPRWRRRPPADDRAAAVDGGRDGSGTCSPRRSAGGRRRATRPARLGAGTVLARHRRAAAGRCRRPPWPRRSVQRAHCIQPRAGTAPTSSGTPASPTCRRCTSSATSTPAWRPTSPGGGAAARPPGAAPAR